MTTVVYSGVPVSHSVVVVWTGVRLPVDTSGGVNITGFDGQKGHDPRFLLGDLRWD